MVVPRRMVRVSGVSPPIVLQGFNSDINTLERGVKERVFYVKDKGQFVSPPLPNPQHFDSALKPVHDRLVKLLPRSAPLTSLGFVETFRGPKRRLYEQAYKSLNEKSLCDKDAEVKVFVKYEKTDFTTKADPVPRIISPRSTRFNISLGRFLRPVEERIFHSLDGLFGHPTVFKGMNAARSGKLMYEKWCMFKDPVAVGMDASRFDQHCSIPALEWEHSIELACFPRRKHRRALRKLLRQQLRNKCKGYVPDGKLKYSTLGGRMSGDMNTSLGNCILMCSMVLAYADSVGVRIQLANNGDDCVVFMERRDYERFERGVRGWFLLMGYSMEVEPPCYTFEELEFCQTHPVFVGPEHDAYIMVRHPKKAIAKDTVCVHGWQSLGMFKGWLHAVGTGGLAMTGRVPIFQDFYRSYLANGKFRKTARDYQSWGVRQLSKGMVRTYGEVLPATRASFFWAFGVTPDEQLVLEGFYRSMVLSDELENLQFQPAMPL